MKVPHPPQFRQTLIFSNTETSVSIFLPTAVSCASRKQSIINHSHASSSVKKIIKQRDRKNTKTLFSGLSYVFFSIDLAISVLNWVKGKLVLLSFTSSPLSPWCLLPCIPTAWLWLGPHYPFTGLGAPASWLPSRPSAMGPGAAPV